MRVPLNYDQAADMLRNVAERSGQLMARRMPLVEARQAQELILGAKVKGKIVLICNEPGEPGAAEEGRDI